MSALAGGAGGVLGGGGGAPGATGGGLCIFTCSAVLSAFGAVAALYDYDLGPESAFFTVQGLGALCFAKCQYLRLAEEKSRLGGGGGGGGPGGAWHRSDWDVNTIDQFGGVRRRRDDNASDLDYLSDLGSKPNKKGKLPRDRSKGQGQGGRLPGS